MSTLRRKLEETLGLVGLDLSGIRGLSMPGADPALASQYHIGEAGAVCIAGSAAAAAALWRLRGGGAQDLEISVLAATAAMRSNKYLQINGERPRGPTDPVTGFYRVRDDRWIYLHSNFANLRAANLKVLQAPAEAAAVAAAAESWDGLELENALFAGGGCGGLIRSREEWAKLAQHDAVAEAPLIELIRIGDAPPQPLPKGDRPLSGVRVLDLTRVLAGPTCARTLAEHGADVLRVTKRGMADSGMFDLDTGLGKRSTFIDLDDPAGAETLRGLIATADIFSQAYRPGSLAGRGLGPADLAALRPGIVCVTLDAWGYSGPWKDRRGYDTVVQCPNGMAWTGEGRKPMFQPGSPQDYVAGYIMAMGAMAALLRRATEGGSWLVRTSLASAGKWIADFGLLPVSELSEVGTEIDPAFIKTLLMDSDSSAGRLTHLVPAARLSETPGFWARPAVAFGTHPPVWPDR